MIVSIEPAVIDSGSYPMTRAAAALGVHRNTMRRYVDQGLIKPHRSKMSGRLYFTGAQLKRFWQIYAK